MVRETSVRVAHRKKHFEEGEQECFGSLTKQLNPFSKVSRVEAFFYNYVISELISDRVNHRPTDVGTNF